MQQRYYDPAIGRFISLDRISFLGRTNLYAYLDDDPVNVEALQGYRARR